MMQSLYAIYGASGFGREVIPLAREQLARIYSLTECIDFIVYKILWII